MDELTDVGPMKTCSGCGVGYGAGEWFWFADGGSVHLSFCQECDPGPENWKRYKRATAVNLVDDKTGEEFSRVVALPERWHE